MVHMGVSENRGTLFDVSSKLSNSGAEIQKALGTHDRYVHWCSTRSHSFTYVCT